MADINKTTNTLWMMSNDEQNPKTTQYTSVSSFLLPLLFFFHIVLFLLTFSRICSLPLAVYKRPREKKKLCVQILFYQSPNKPWIVKLSDKNYIGICRVLIKGAISEQKLQHRIREVTRCRPNV